MLKFLPNYYSSKAIILYFIIIVCSVVLFPGTMLPPLWMAFGFFDVFCFFYFTSRLTTKWRSLSSQTFERNLFTTALIIRTIYVSLIYFFYLFMTGNTFEFEAADSEFYHRFSMIVARAFLQGRYYIFNINNIPFSDRGYPFILGIWYILTNSSVFLTRIAFSFLNAWMCVLIYHISQRNFGEQAARISAIMAMVLPAFIYYSGLHLKETVMIFLLMAFIDQTDSLLHSRSFKFGNIFKVVLLGTSLFFFRTSLAAAAWFALFSAFSLSSEKLMSQYRRIVIISWLTIAIAFVLSGDILNEVSSTIEMRNSNQKQQLDFFSTREAGNKLAKYGNAAIFIPIIIPAPFPTLVNIPEQKNAMMINGSLFTRNIYVFFVFIAMYILYKKKQLRKNLLLLVFLVSYLLILAKSGFALSPRFHVPALPFLLIFAGYGITQTTRNYGSYYVLYLITISVIIIGWNWFKLAGRGFL